MGLQPIELVFLAEDGTEIPPKHMTDEQVQLAVRTVRPWIDRALRTLEVEPNLPLAELEQIHDALEYAQLLARRLIIRAAFDTPRGRA